MGKKTSVACTPCKVGRLKCYPSTGPACTTCYSRNNVCYYTASPPASLWSRGEDTLGGPQGMAKQESIDDDPHGFMCAAKHESAEKSQTVGQSASPHLTQRSDSFATSIPLEHASAGRDTVNRQRLPPWQTSSPNSGFQSIRAVIIPQRNTQGSPSSQGRTTPAAALPTVSETTLPPVSESALPTVTEPSLAEGSVLLSPPPKQPQQTGSSLSPPMSVLPSTVLNENQVNRTYIKLYSQVPRGMTVASLRSCLSIGSLISEMNQAWGQMTICKIKMTFPWLSVNDQERFLFVWPHNANECWVVLFDQIAQAPVWNMDTGHCVLKAKAYELSE